MTAAVLSSPEVSAIVPMGIKSRAACACLVVEVPGVDHDIA